MNDDDRTIATLRAGMADEVRGHHFDAAVRTPAPRRSPARYLAVAACLLGVGVVAAVHAGVTSSHDTPAAGGACAGAVVTSELPTWARDGFSPGADVVPHVTGAQGRIVAVLFTGSLHAPPATGENNKILWVAKDEGTGPLVIRAELDGTTVTRTVAGGPGPSTVDLPTPGCWQLTLTWSGHRDTMAVPYGAGR